MLHLKSLKAQKYLSSASEKWFEIFAQTNRKWDYLSVWYERIPSAKNCDKLEISAFQIYSQILYAYILIFLLSSHEPFSDFSKPTALFEPQLHNRGNEKFYQGWMQSR